MIQPPSYKKNAVPSPRGWRHPRTGELLKKQKITQEQIDEYLGIGTVSAPEPEVLTEAPTNESEFVEEHFEEDPTAEDLEYEAMTKSELEELGRDHGIELDRREKKTTLIERLKNAIE